MIITLNSPDDAVRWIANALGVPSCVVRQMWGYADDMDYVDLLATLVLMPMPAIKGMREKARRALRTLPVVDMIDYECGRIDVLLN